MPRRDLVDAIRWYLWNPLLIIVTDLVLGMSPLSVAVLRGRRADVTWAFAAFALTTVINVASARLLAEKGRTVAWVPLMVYEAASVTALATACWLTGRTP